MVNSAKEEKSLEVAKAALQEGADVAFVARITGLSEEVVKQLQDEILKH